MLAPTAIVIVAVPDPGAAIVVGLKLTVVPAGTPIADSATALLKLPLIVVVMDDVPCAPCTTLNAAGLAVAVKLGFEVTVRFTVVVRVMPPPTAVTVNG